MTMTWVRFWSHGMCGSGINPPEEFYEWYDKTPEQLDAREAEMLDTAREYVPSWMEGSERGFEYGWEIVRVVTPEVRAMLISRQKLLIEHHTDALETCKFLLTSLENLTDAGGT